LQPAGYYRIQAVDRDGKIRYSEVVRVKQDTSSKLEVYPNPVTDRLFVQVIATDGRLTITNLAGRIVKSVVLPQNGTVSTSIGIADLPPGLYVVRSGESNLKFLKL
jgi:hypothetical protein